MGTIIQVIKGILGDYSSIWAFPQIRCTFFGGVPKLRIVTYWGLYCGSLSGGNCHMVVSQNRGTPI